MIRVVEYDEAEQCAELGERFYKEQKPFSQVPYCPEKIIHLVKHVWLPNPQKYLPLVAVDKNNKIYGGFVGVIEDYYFNYESYATDVLIYVDKDKRGDIAAIRFLREFEKWARSQGVKEIRPATSTRININRLQQFYEKMGYQTTGFNFLKEI